MSKFNSLIQVEVGRVEDAAFNCIARIKESRRRTLIEKVRELYRRNYCVYPLLVEWAARLRRVKLPPIEDGSDEQMLDWWEMHKGEYTDHWCGEASDVWWTYSKHEEQFNRAQILLLAARNESRKGIVMYLSTEDYEHLFS